MYNKNIHIFWKNLKKTLNTYFTFKNNASFPTL
jgi:hypothetical protein